MDTGIHSAIKALARGSIALLVDDLSATPRAFLICAAATTTPEMVSVFVNEARAVVCAAMGEERVRELGLPMMAARGNADGFEFAVSVESRHGVTTGISSADRAKTLQTIAITNDAKREIVTPGHIFPLVARKGGVLVRSGIAEAAVDLMKLAECAPVAAICQCLNTTGGLVNEAEIELLHKQQGFPVATVTAIIRHRLATERLVERIASAQLPTQIAGEFSAVCFLSHIDQAEHLVLVKGEIAGGEPVLVRVQAEDRLGDLLGGDHALGLERIRHALQSIEQRGRGVFVYIRHPRRGVLERQINRLKGAAGAQEEPVMREAAMGGARAAELQEFGIGAQILKSLGVRKLILLSNSDRPIKGLDAFGLELVSREPLVSP